ncbi:MAG: magnesium chelatase ATPase subunit I [Pseudomonadota bacterium]
MSIFPFSAIVGQEELKRALILTAIDPLIGGVLAFGDRGAGKSTAIRALAALLPQVETIRDCPYRRDPADVENLCADCRALQKKGDLPTRKEPAPVVDLPLGATEDRVIGALDLESALVRGEKRFEPGLLARAHRGYLYIDEVNLLDDHLVDVLLDVAASGENVVEREGLSVRHPARFVLVGSGNPEEGELRPQLLDRFGLSVDVRTPTDLAERIEVVRRRDAFERDPDEFLSRWKRKDAATRRKIEKARATLDEVETSDDALRLASSLCIALGADGLRGELTMMRAARALAAFDGKETVEKAQLSVVAPSALRHRLRKDPLDDADAGVRVERAIEEVFGP